MPEVAQQDSKSHSFAPLLLGALTVGFGTAAVMWTLGFVLRFPGVDAPAPLLAVGLLLVLAAGLVCGARTATRGRRTLAGSLTGFVAGMVNLLVLGALLIDPASGQTRGDATMIVIGWLAFTVIAGAIVGIIAELIWKEQGAGMAGFRPNWPVRFAVVTALATLVLLMVGGTVTSTESGMAVEDWPTSAGYNMFLLPLSRMTGGVFYEHAHRLFGALIGLMTVALAIVTVTTQKRGWVRIYAAAGIVFVVAQGVLGGQRVELDVRALGVVHGVTGQLFFAFLCAWAAFLTESWRNGDQVVRAGGTTVRTGEAATRKLTVALFAVLLVQVSFGAVLRHMHTDGAPSMHAMAAHVGFSLVAMTMTLIVAFRLRAIGPKRTLFRRIGTGLLHSVNLQMGLGVAALALVLMYKTSDPFGEVAVATAHQLVGAALMGLAALAAVWSWRLLGDGAPEDFVTSY